jgi:hypothetical protein
MYAASEMLYIDIQYTYTTIRQRTVYNLTIWPFYTTSAVYKSGKFGYMWYLFGFIPWWWSLVDQNMYEYLILQYKYLRNNIVHFGGWVLCTGYLHCMKWTIKS